MNSLLPTSSPPATYSTAPPPSTPAPGSPSAINSTAPSPSPSAPAPPTPTYPLPLINSSTLPPTPQTPSGTRPYSGHPPPSSSVGGKSSDSGWGGGGGGSVGVSKEVVVGIVSGGVVVLLILVVSIICCVRCTKKKKRSSRDYSGEGYYVPNPLPHLGTLEDDHNYNVQPQHWQQIYSPPVEYFQAPQPPPPPAPIPPTLPPKSPSPAPFLSCRGGSSSSIGSENLLTSSPSPGIPLGFSKSTFSYVELAMATDNFSKANILGQGDYGWTVHKGILPNGMEIAVKSVTSGNGKGEQEFQMEVEIIGRVHHKHLVSLVGYCITESLWLLVYEFVPNSTLEFHLHEKGEPTVDWPSRLRIAKGSAKGLAYLHEDCHPKIIHGDIKAANILLNHKFEAKVVDFGRAKVFSDGNTHVSTRVIGTLGYLAPEYVASGKLSDRSDVFSFGVVLLELVTGRRPTDSARTYKNDNFVDWARPLIIRFLEKNDFDALVDPRLQDNYDRNEMARMIVCAAACVRHSAQLRPLMSQVVRAMEGQISLSDEGLTPEQSPMYSSYESLDYDSSQYKGDKNKPRQVAVSREENCSSEYGGTTSEYGVYPSGLSSELPSCEMTREMEMGKMKGDSQGRNGTSGL